MKVVFSCICSMIIVCGFMIPVFAQTDVYTDEKCIFKEIQFAPIPFRVFMIYDTPTTFSYQVDRTDIASVLVEETRDEIQEIIDKGNSTVSYKSLVTNSVDDWQLRYDFNFLRKPVEPLRLDITYDANNKPYSTEILKMHDAKNCLIMKIHTRQPIKEYTDDELVQKATEFTNNVMTEKLIKFNSNLDKIFIDLELSKNNYNLVTGLLLVLCAVLLIVFLRIIRILTKATKMMTQASINYTTKQSQSRLNILEMMTQFSSELNGIKKLNQDWHNANLEQMERFVSHIIKEVNKVFAYVRSTTLSVPSSEIKDIEPPKNIQQDHTDVEQVQPVAEPKIVQPEVKESSLQKIAGITKHLPFGKKDEEHSDVKDKNYFIRKYRDDIKNRIDDKDLRIQEIIKFYTEKIKEYGTNQTDQQRAEMLALYELGNGGSWE